MKRQAKVLQVCRMYYPMPGGIERVVQDIAEGLNHKTDMEVLTCQVKGRETVEKIHGVKVRRCASLGTVFSLPVSPTFLIQFRRKSKDKDILHLHLPFPLADLACLLSGYQGKVVLWWHSDVVRQKKLMLIYKPLMDWLLKRADAIIVATEGHIEGSSYLKAYREKCYIIPFGVKKDVIEGGDRYLQKKASDTPKSEESPCKLLFIGRLVYYKGCDVLLEAMAKTKGTVLNIVGDGPLKKELEEQCERLGLSSRVSFAGNLSDEELRRELADCDVFVLPSVAKSEAFGIVQIEAMAYGKPVINTKLPSGVPYVSLDKQTGLTVEPGNPDALADAIQFLADNPAIATEYGRAAAERVRHEFQIEKMQKAVFQVYEKLTEG